MPTPAIIWSTSVKDLSIQKSWSENIQYAMGNVNSSRTYSDLTRPINHQESRLGISHHTWEFQPPCSWAAYSPGSLPWVDRSVPCCRQNSSVASGVSRTRTAHLPQAYDTHNCTGPARKDPLCMRERRRYKARVCQDHKGSLPAGLKAPRMRLP